MIFKTFSFKNSVFLLATSFFLGACSKITTTKIADPQPPVVQEEVKTLTKDWLLKDCPIPEKRDFPLSQKVSACEDFHQYVCSEAESAFKLPSDRGRWIFAFTDSNERVLFAKKRYFKALQLGYEPTDPKVRPLKNFYLSCMNQKSKKQEELSNAKREWQKISIQKNKENLLSFIESRIAGGDFSFVGIDNAANLDDPSKWDLFVYIGGLTLPTPADYSNADAKKDLKALAFSFFKSLSLDQAAQRAQWVVDFESSLASKTPSPAEFRVLFGERLYNTREEMLQRYPHLKLERILNLMPESVKIRNIMPETFAQLNELFEKSNVDALQSVLLFHSLKDTMDVAYPKFFSKYYNFGKKYLGYSEVRESLDERCTKEVSDNFSMELDKELSDILFPAFAEEELSKVVTEVRDAIHKGVGANKWLTDDARVSAQKKLQVAKLALVKPKREEDWGFKPVLNYSDKFLLKNKKALSKAVTEKLIKELLDPRNRDQWSAPPLLVNANYSPSDNKFVLLQGLLQFPFFDSNQQIIENLGGVGMVTGHELGHAVDDSGARFDEEGRLKSWMTQADLAEFKKRTQPFVDQFNKIGHDGKLTLGENIADNVGLTFAYDAATPYFKDQNDKKRFFEAYARNWCGVMLPSVRESRLKTDPHALPDARINEQVKLQDGFYEAYGCKAGDKMFIAPEDRTRVW